MYDGGPGSFDDSHKMIKDALSPTKSISNNKGKGLSSPPPYMANSISSIKEPLKNKNRHIEKNQKSRVQQPRERRDKYLVLGQKAVEA